MKSKILKCSICILVVAGIALSLGWFYFLSGKDNASTPQSVEDLRSIAQALEAFAVKEGALPYDARGSEYALYKLRPFLKTLPVSLPQTVWNDEQKKLNSCPYEYLNQQECEFYTQSHPSNDVVVLSEKVTPSAKGVNLITQNGGVLWYQPTDVSIQEVMPVVGKRMGMLPSSNIILGDARLPR